MRENGDGSLQTGSALAVGDQKAQKHADGRGAVFRRCPSAPLTGIQDELPQLVSIKLAWIFSQVFQQIAQVKAVIIKRGIAGAALLAHPATERNQKDRIHDDLLLASGVLTAIAIGPAALLSVLFFLLSAWSLGCLWHKAPPCASERSSDSPLP